MFLLNQSSHLFTTPATFPPTPHPNRPPFPSVHPLYQCPPREQHGHPNVHLPTGCPRCFLLLLIAVFNATSMLGYEAMNMIYLYYELTSCAYHNDGLISLDRILYNLCSIPPWVMCLSSEGYRTMQLASESKEDLGSSGHFLSKNSEFESPKFGQSLSQNTGFEVIWMAGLSTNSGFEGATE